MPLPLDATRMKKALAALDTRLDQPTRLVIGGGAAMVLAYDHPLASGHVDAFTTTSGLTAAELAGHARAVAEPLEIDPGWLSSHIDTYTHVLPDDYATRLRRVLTGTMLLVDALGPEDLLVMKCFAARAEDRPHAQKLLRVADDLSIVDDHLSKLAERRYPKAARAADYFDDLRDAEGL